MIPQDEFARRREVEEGRKAQTLLDNQYFKSVIERVRDRIYGDFAKSRYDDDATRKTARMMLGLVDTLLKEIKGDVDTGTAASEQLRRAETPKREIL